MQVTASESGLMGVSLAGITADYGYKKFESCSVNHGEAAAIFMAANLSGCCNAYSYFDAAADNRWLR